MMDLLKADAPKTMLDDLLTKHLMMQQGTFPTPQVPEHTNTNLPRLCADVVETLQRGRAVLLVVKDWSTQDYCFNTIYQIARPYDTTIKNLGTWQSFQHGWGDLLIVQQDQLHTLEQMDIHTVMWRTMMVKITGRAMTKIMIEPMVIQEFFKELLDSIEKYSQKP